MAGKVVFKAVPMTSNAQEKREGIIKFQICTQDDRNSARAYYRKNIRKPIEVKIELEVWRKRRTMKQSGLLHAIIGEIAILQGVDKGIVKTGILEQYGVRIRYKDKVFAKPDGICTTAEMSKLIDGAIREACEQGIDMQTWKLEHEQFELNEKDKLAASVAGKEWKCPECREKAEFKPKTCPRCNGAGIF